MAKHLCGNPYLHHIKPIRPRFGREYLQRLAPCLINTRIVKQSQNLSFFLSVNNNNSNN